MPEDIRVHESAEKTAAEKEKTGQSKAVKKADAGGKPEMQGSTGKETAKPKPEPSGKAEKAPVKSSTKETSIPSSTKKKLTKAEEERLNRGYIALGIFMVVLALDLIIQPPIPIQTVLVALAIVIMIIGQAKIQDLIAGLILHPIMAMTSGFLIAGAMGLAGGFDVLLYLLSQLAEIEVAGFPVLGYVGVAVILANIPTIMPMPCGRILAAALLPGVVIYGNKLGEQLYGTASATNLEPYIVMSTLTAAFIVNAAASCGPSPLGGIGGIGEGNMGVPIGSSGKAQSAGIIIGTGVVALVIALVTKTIPMGI